MKIPVSEMKTFPIHFYLFMLIDFFTCSFSPFPKTQTSVAVQRSVGQPGASIELQSWVITGRGLSYVSFYAIFVFRFNLQMFENFLFHGVKFNLLNGKHLKIIV